MNDKTKTISQIQTQEQELNTTPLLSSTSEVILFFEPLELSTDNLAEDNNIQLDSDEFKRGLKDSSYYAGIYTGLINSGMSMDDSITLILNKMNVDHSVQITNINANATIESSKNATILKEKEML